MNQICICSRMMLGKRHLVISGSVCLHRLTFTPSILPRSVRCSATSRVARRVADSKNMLFISPGSSFGISRFPCHILSVSIGNLLGICNGSVAKRRSHETWAAPPVQATWASTWPAPPRFEHRPQLRKGESNSSANVWTSFKSSLNIARWNLKQAN